MDIIHACEATARVHRVRYRSRCDVAIEDLRRPGTSSRGASHATGGTRAEESGGASEELEETRLLEDQAMVRIVLGLRTGQRQERFAVR
jgi:hypothetical protein